MLSNCTLSILSQRFFLLFYCFCESLFTLFTANRHVTEDLNLKPASITTSLQNMSPEWSFEADFIKN